MTDAKALIELVRVRYGSLEAPNFQWTRDAFDANPHEPIVDALRARFEVRDLTDPNDDVCVNLAIDGPGSAEWQVYVSLVGPFVAVTRGDPAGARVVSGPDGGDSADQALVDALSAAGLEVLSRAVLETPIDMPMFNAEPDDVCLFNALFTDADMRPWCPSGPASSGAA